MSHIYSRANFQSIAQCFEVIESYARKAKIEIERVDSVLEDKIICDKKDCKHRKYNDHDRSDT